MKLEKILTIVIPSYNIENYIDDNIQTMISCEQFSKIDIIFINDGSNDRTEDIARRYADKYPENIRLISKSNGGHGSVINRGIQEAKGKYFKVIDGDDYVDTEELARLILQLEATNADVCISDFRRISALTGEVKRVYALKEFKENFHFQYNREYPIDTILPHLTATIHGLTYRTEVLKKNYNNIQFSERVFYEDNEYRLFPMAFASTLYLSDCCVYYYVVDQANQSISIKKKKKRISHLFTVERRMMDFYKRHMYHKVTRGKIQYAEDLIAGLVYAIFEIYLTFDDNVFRRKYEIKKFDRELKKESIEIYQTSNRYRIIRYLRMSQFLLYLPMRIEFQRFLKKRGS